MENIRPSVLIAEDQIFIALEAERILKEVFDCDIHLCRRAQLAAVVATKRFDIAIVEISGNFQEDIALVSLARASGMDVAVLCLTEDLHDLQVLLPNVARIEKPFNDTDFRQFISDFKRGRALI